MISILFSKKYSNVVHDVITKTPKTLYLRGFLFLLTKMYQSIYFTVRVKRHFLPFYRLFKKFISLENCRESLTNRRRNICYEKKWFSSKRSFLFFSICYNASFCFHHTISGGILPTRKRIWNSIVDIISVLFVVSFCSH